MANKIGSALPKPLHNSFPASVLPLQSLSLRVLVGSITVDWQASLKAIFIRQLKRTLF